VIEADICANIPLPGSEPDEGTGEGHIVDVVVCALSLMGSNWPKCIREAWRILKPTYVSLPLHLLPTELNQDTIQRTTKNRRSDEPIRKCRPICFSRLVNWVQVQIQGMANPYLTAFRAHGGVYHPERAQHAFHDVRVPKGRQEGQDGAGLGEGHVERENPQTMRIQTSLTFATPSNCGWMLYIPCFRHVLSATKQPITSLPRNMENTSA